MSDIIGVLAVIGFLGAILCPFFESEGKRKIASAMTAIAIVLIASIAMALNDVRYKDGQIDALTGEIRYELVQNPGSTRTWEKIERE